MTIKFRKMSTTLLSIFSVLTISAIMLSISACVVTPERRPSGAPEPAPRPVDLGRVQGLWFIDAANYPGKLEFYRDGRRWAGRVWFDSNRQWEALTEMFFDPRTGEIEFTRPAANQRYFGTLSGHQLVGTFTSEGKNLPWEAKRR